MHLEERRDHRAIHGGGIACREIDPIGHRDELQSACRVGLRRSDPAEERSCWTDPRRRATAACRGGDADARGRRRRRIRLRTPSDRRHAGRGLPRPRRSHVVPPANARPSPSRATAHPVRRNRRHSRAARRSRCCQLKGHPFDVHAVLGGCSRANTDLGTRRTSLDQSGRVRCFALQDQKADGDDDAPCPNFEHLTAAPLGDRSFSMRDPFGNPLCSVDSNCRRRTDADLNAGEPVCS